ncbi:hypothetical protein E1292_23775 [Nonomuraea deserti]|uniref:Outer membrane channel protein CpnT-like N-terminal domain-containing protein n=1 Tax=Nonomuraea deserti TaxID=1848322 RepID=A0A4R4VQA5_9ACTN|nr:hypothetical protein [Nonomuraea deserti]TDD02300.1 hypothetical protein E1292_23775 [Nonomuraea deserti]
MAVVLPAALQTPFSMLGVEWPSEDEDHLRACGAVYRSCATNLADGVNPSAHGVVTYASQNNSGDHIDELNTFWADYHGDGEQKGHLQSLATSLHALADGHDLYAKVVETVKIVLKLLAMYALIVLLWAAASAAVSGGFAALKARGSLMRLRAFARKALATLRHRFARYFGQKLIRGVETRVRRMLGAKAPKFAAPAKGSRLATAFGRTTALATAGAATTLLEEAPNSHSPSPVHQPKGDDKNGKYHIGRGEPTVGYDHDFPYDPDEKPTLDDYKSWFKWRAMLRGGELKREDLKDGLAVYEHYLNGSGEDFEVDFERAYKEDRDIRDSVDYAVEDAKSEAMRLHKESGQSHFRMTGGLSSGNSDTENWQKTLGSYTQWGSADVRVEGGRATMEITVHAEDRYNFNKGAHDIATDKPDDANGRFETLGWARSFRTHGALTRTVTWDIPSD